MRLDQLLVHKNLCESRVEAQELIASGAVLVDGIAVTKQTRQFEEVVHIEVLTRRKYVSRGGEKLMGVLLDVYGSDDEVKNALRSCIGLDVGASTGGFTDCLIQNGVEHVDAVDVGTDQIHSKIAKDERVSVYEKTDIRHFEQMTGSVDGVKRTYDVIVGDISFVALSTLFDTILSFTKIGTRLFLLIKPQFEVGKGNTKKGIVKDKTLVDAVITKYMEDAISKGLINVQIFQCVIQGGDGNQEYFLYGIRN
jgi:23S rRNA (cytidine1920-2'-O)/16S rRNA (cytidine1409-2'-O)-methyltransferase